MALWVGTNGYLEKQWVNIDIVIIDNMSSASSLLSDTGIEIWGKKLIAAKTLKVLRVSHKNGNEKTSTGLKN